MTSTSHPDEAAILAALPIRPRPELYVEATADAHGTFPVLEAALAGALAEGDDSDAYIGRAVPCGSGWYLGCIECRAEIEEADSGMCRSCRQDTAFQEDERLGWQEAQAGPWDREDY